MRGDALGEEGSSRQKLYLTDFSFCSSPKPHEATSLLLQPLTPLFQPHKAALYLTDLFSCSSPKPHETQEKEKGAATSPSRFSLSVRLHARKHHLRCSGPVHARKELRSSKPSACFPVRDPKSRALQSTELQAWWKDAVEIGHGDLKNNPWWQRLISSTENIPQTRTVMAK